MNHELIGLSPDNLNRLFTGNGGLDTGITAAANALRDALEACEAIDAEVAALKANKYLSPSGRVKKIRDKEQQLRHAAVAQLERAKSLVESKISDLERRMSEPPAPDEDGLRRQDNLVAAIRKMKPEDRLELMNRMDDELAGAILRNHPAALGMAANEQDLFRLAWRKRRFSAENDQLERNNRALGYIDRASPIVMEYCKKKMASLNPMHVASR